MQSAHDGLLKAPGAVLLVSCYELGHQPLGLAWPLAFFRRAGFQPDCLDISVEGFDPAKVSRARFVAVSVPMHTALRLGVRAAARIRRLHPAAHLCFHGLYAFLNAEYLLRDSADAVVAGEVEEALVAWAEVVNGTRSGNVEGVRTRAHESAPVIRKLAFPRISRDALPPLERYAHLQAPEGIATAGVVEASRGCLHLCRHCPIPSVYGGRFFVVPAEVVLDDIRAQAASGARHITFADPDFLNGPKHSLAIVRAMHAEFPDLTFDFTAKVEHLLAWRDLLPEFAACGCAFAVSAVESLSDAVLERMDKGHSRADVVEALSALRAAGIPLRPSWLPFTPWSTLDDYLEMLDFVEAEGLVGNVDPVQYTIRLLIPPRSLLLDHDGLETCLGPLDEESFTYRWTHPDPRMDRLQEAVSEAVENAARAGGEDEETFAAIRALALEAAGRPADSESGAPALVPAVARAARAPRLTEPWFC